jgi:hypothetical protein
MFVIVELFYGTWGGGKEKRMTEYQHNFCVDRGYKDMY